MILRPNAIEITQINPMKEGIAGADGHDNELPGGHGLASFKKQLESHQGTYIPVTVIDDSPGLFEQVQA